RVERRRECIGRGGSGRRARGPVGPSPNIPSADHRHLSSAGRAGRLGVHPWWAETALITHRPLLRRSCGDASQLRSGPAQWRGYYGYVHRRWTERAVADQRRQARTRRAARWQARTRLAAPGPSDRSPRPPPGPHRAPPPAPRPPRAAARSSRAATAAAPPLAIAAVARDRPAPAPRTSG